MRLFVSLALALAGMGEAITLRKSILRPSASSFLHTWDDPFDFTRNLPRPDKKPARGDFSGMSHEDFLLDDEGEACGGGDYHVVDGHKFYEDVTSADFVRSELGLEEDLKKIDGNVGYFGKMKLKKAVDAHQQDDDHFSERVKALWDRNNKGDKPAKVAGRSAMGNLWHNIKTDLKAFFRRLKALGKAIINDKNKLKYVLLIVRISLILTIGIDPFAILDIFLFTVRTIDNYTKPRYVADSEDGDGALVCRRKNNFTKFRELMDSFVGVYDKSKTKETQQLFVYANYVMTAYRVIGGVAGLPQI